MLTCNNTAVGILLGPKRCSKSWLGRCVWTSECSDVCGFDALLRSQGVVERFIPAADVPLVRACFAGLWALEGDGAEEAIALALADPTAYVLKPQREGGGNNLYGDDMVARLRQRSGLGAFILMQRIRPPLNRALFMRAAAAAPADALGELGIYSVYLSVRGKVLQNEPVGHLLRTKTADSNEGGVAAGFAVLDSPLLV